MSNGEIPGIALNEDCNHFALSRADRPLDEAALTAWVDQYAGTQVRELLLNPNGMRTVYDSKVWEPIWQGYDPDGPDDQPFFAGSRPALVAVSRAWLDALWRMHRAGIDPYAVWLRRARQVGLGGWLTMRMNDAHEANQQGSFMHSEFWRSRPDLRRVPYRDMERRDNCFDYAQPEVRAHHFKLIQEFCERWDFDGLELDWMRFGYNLRPGHEAADAHCLTDFTRDVRRLLDHWEQRRGHAIKLGARIPSRPQTASGLGYDYLAWAREGLVDLLVVTPFWEACEFDMPVDLWRELLRDTAVTLAAGLDINVRPDPATLEQKHSLQTARGAAAAMLDRGAERLYLFNFMDDPTDTHPALGRDYPALLRELGSLGTLEGKPRRHVVTFSDVWAVGEPAAVPLPARCRANAWRAFRVPIGPAPETGRAEVRLSIVAEGGEKTSPSPRPSPLGRGGGPDGRSPSAPFAEATGPTPQPSPSGRGGETGWAEAKGLEVRLNGELLELAGPVKVEAPCPQHPFFAWQAPVSALQRGYNVIEVVPRAETTIGWVEVYVEP